MVGNALFSIGSFGVYGYGIMVALGAVTAIVVTYILGKNTKIMSGVFIDAMWVCVIGAFVGAKLLSVIVNIIRNHQASLGMEGVFSGFIVYGGIILAALSLALFAHFTKYSLAEITDTFVPGVALGQGIGRIGCFLAGCCYGKPYDGFGHVVFKNSQHAPNGIPLYPTQIVSSIFMILLGTVLIIVYKKLREKPGYMTFLYFAAYGIGRFIIEFFRYYPEDSLMNGLSGSQIISIFVGLFGLSALLLQTFRDKNNYDLAVVKADENAIENNNCEQSDVVSCNADDNECGNV